MSSFLASLFSLSSNSNASMEMPTPAPPAAGRQCWICYGEEDEDWIRPCGCRGTGAWVHQGCLLSWIDSRLGGSSSQSVEEESEEELPSHLILPKLSCPQCHVPYRLEEGLLMPKSVMMGMQVIYDGWRWLVIRSAVFGCMATFYGCCWLYGASCVLLVTGREEFGTLLISLDPMGMMRIFIGFPLMPFLAVSLRHTGLAWTLAPLLPPLLLRPGDLNQYASPAWQLLSLPLITTGWSHLHRQLFARLRARINATATPISSSRWGLYRLSETLLMPFMATGIAWSATLALRHWFGIKLPGSILTKTLLTGGFLLFTTDVIDQLGQLQGLYGQMTRRVLEQ